MTERVIRIDLDREIERERVSSMSTETTKWRGLNNTFVDGSNFSFIFFRFIKPIFCLEYFEYRLLSKYFSASSLSNCFTQIIGIFWYHQIITYLLIFWNDIFISHLWSHMIMTGILRVLRHWLIFSHLMKLYVVLWSNEF